MPTTSPDAGQPASAPRSPIAVYWRVTGDDEEPVTYRSPSTVACPVCGAPPEQPCRSLRGGGVLSDGWHAAREHVPA